MLWKGELWERVSVQGGKPQWFNVASSAHEQMDPVRDETGKQSGALSP